MYMCYGCLYICICVIHDGCLYICICVMDVYIYVYVLYIMDCTWQPVYHSVRPITLSFTEPMVQRGLPLQFERRTQIINLVFIMFSSFFCCLMSEWYRGVSVYKSRYVRTSIYTYTYLGPETYMPIYMRIYIFTSCTTYSHLYTFSHLYTNTFSLASSPDSHLYKYSHLNISTHPLSRALLPYPQPTHTYTTQLEPTHDKWTEWQNRYLNPKL
jgi:hypothetical protein